MFINGYLLCTAVIVDIFAFFEHGLYPIEIILFNVLEQCLVRIIRDFH